MVIKIIRVIMVIKIIRVIRAIRIIKVITIGSHESIRVILGRKNRLVIMWLGGTGRLLCG